MVTLLRFEFLIYIGFRIGSAKQLAYTLGVYNRKKTILFNNLAIAGE